MRFTGYAIFRFSLLVTLAIPVMAASMAEAVQPEDILLVVNVRIPASRALAELYARQRHIPNNRIVEIEVPPIGVANPPEEILFDDYERLVAKPVRTFMTHGGLQTKIKCIVTFWGVPFRIAARQLTPADLEELTSLHREFDQDREGIEVEVSALEKSAANLDSGFSPAGGGELSQLTARMQAAMNSTAKSLSTIKDVDARKAQATQLVASIKSMLGDARAIEVIAQPALARNVPHGPTAADVAAARDALARTDRELREAQGFQPDATRRRDVRELARKSLGSMGVATILSAQIESFRVEQSAAALDNELALLWWQSYPRAMWIPNPLYWQNAAHPARGTLPMIMVTRIDGPSEPQVRNLIKTSFEVEQKGLQGQVVLDARGKAASDAYGQYDQSIRNLNELLHDHTRLNVTFDDHEALIPPHSIKDPIAVYCGWYSLRNYAPPGPFAPGAVGFHVASFELVSLRGRGEHGWVRGLLADGVGATVGPVAEPYLQSFPRADEFFPLLMTGKLSIAEVYWLTTPMVSWMQTCIADPLYNPFKVNPPLKVDDLPPALRNLLAPGSPPTQPSSRPVR